MDKDKDLGIDIMRIPCRIEKNITHITIWYFLHEGHILQLPLAGVSLSRLT